MQKSVCFDLSPWWSKLESRAGYCSLWMVIFLVAWFLPASRSYGVVSECSGVVSVVLLQFFLRNAIDKSWTSMKDVDHPIDEGFFPIQRATLDLLGLRNMKHDS